MSPAVIAALTGLVTGVMGAMFTFLLTRGKQSDKVLLKIVKGLEARIDHLEGDREECTKENAALREEVGRQRAEILGLQRENDAQRIELTELRAKVNRLESKS